jgi:helicase required for RNAi-mediated heterochromatin assembly 1
MALINAEVVTTTGLSKYRALLSAACPRVVMIEEAAETMEPPVTAGCVPSVEHLILVGDHKQLRPQCGVKSLETEPFNLNVSMFERIVDNNLPYKMLKRQRRMIPEVRRLLDPIYKNDIKDHISMRNPEVRPPVSGMGGVNSFFYTHAWADSVDEQLSSTNVQEADMVVEFYDYLINNGLTESEITILTFYNGQRKLLLRKLRNHHRLSRMGTEQNRIFKVLTVDSYQGEENEVVLLSLVKSNDQGRIGFIGVENRICVALSRAKRGFYMFGNAELLVGENKLWAKVINILLADTSVIEEDRHPASEPHGRVVFRIPLRCSNHNVRTYIEQIEDWDKIDGGCQKMCSHSLACGHFCDLNCHPFSHDKTVCLEQCKKVLQCGHRCIQQCYDQCRCSICGTKEPRTLTNGNGDIAGVADSGGDTSSQGSNVRAWNAFASGDRVQHDAMLHEMQRERYLQDQMKTVSSEAVKNVAADTKVLPPRQAALPEAQIDAMALDPKALVPSDAASPVAVDGITAPMSPSANAPAPRKVKVSHKDRFKRTAPATALISTHAASPTKATPPPTLFTPPPVGYTGASSLYPALQPLRMVQNQPATPQSATFGTVRVAPPPEMNGEEDLLIDLAEY